MSLDSFKDLFVEQLMDMYDAEKQLVEALPKVAESASHKELEQAVRQHLKETKEHVKRLESIFEEIQMEPEEETCEAMQGLVEEGEEILEEEGDESVKDAAIIAAAQRIEHYEIAGYGALRTFAQQLGLQNAVGLLERTLEEEKMADKKLTEVALGIVNPDAGRSEDQDQQEDEEKPSRSSAGSGTKRRGSKSR